ncbi:hypothetical protein HDV00_001716 [Rhizophlyctis rosea]|nr:hypothetical protein HDV00_001716 [Rhizophlyctis rosea]
MAIHRNYRNNRLLKMAMSMGTKTWRKLKWWMKLGRFKHNPPVVQPVALQPATAPAAPGAAAQNQPMAEGQDQPMEEAEVGAEYPTGLPQPAGGVQDANQVIMNGGYLNLLHGPRAPEGGLWRDLIDTLTPLHAPLGVWDLEPRIAHISDFLRRRAGFQAIVHSIRHAVDLGEIWHIGPQLRFFTARLLGPLTPTDWHMRLDGDYMQIQIAGSNAEVLQERVHALRAFVNALNLDQARWRISEDSIGGAPFVVRIDEKPIHFVVKYGFEDPMFPIVGEGRPYELLLRWRKKYDTLNTETLAEYLRTHLPRPAEHAVGIVIQFKRLGTHANEILSDKKGSLAKWKLMKNKSLFADEHATWDRFLNAIEFYPMLEPFGASKVEIDVTCVMNVGQ